MQGKKTLLIFMLLLMAFNMIPLSLVWAADSMPDSISISDARSMAYYDGYIYVAQRGAGKVSRISTATGQVSDVLAAGSVSNAMAVAINSDGDLFYTRDSNRSIFKIPAVSLTNLPLDATRVASQSQPYFTGTFDYMYGLTFDANDTLYVTDYTTRGIYKLDPGQTNPVAVITNASQPINSIAFNPGGNLYYVDNNNKIHKIKHDDLASKPDNDPTKINLLETASNPSANGIVFMPDGTHFLSSLRSNVVYKHTFQEEAAIADAKALLPSSLTVTEGTYTNLLTYFNELTGMSETGTTLTLATSNANVANDGNITYTSAAVNGNIVVTISKDGIVQTKTIDVTVSAHTPTQAELTNASIAAAKALLPSSLTVTEGTYTNLLTYLNELTGMSETGVTLTLASSNDNVADNGDITYTRSSVSGNVTVQINKANGNQDTKTIAVTVLASTRAVSNVNHVTFAATPTSITLDWTNPSIAINSIKILDGVRNLLAQITGNTCTFTGLLPDMVYTYTIIVVDDSGAESSGVTISPSTSEAPTLTLENLYVNFDQVNLQIGETASVVVTAVYSDRSSAVVTPLVAWSSDHTDVASVSSSGVITTNSAGSAIITGTLEQLSVHITVTVSPVSDSATVTAISVDPIGTGISLSLGAAKQLTVTATYSDNTTADITASAAYATSNEHVAVVSAAGAITAVDYGDAEITVSYEGQSKTVTINVPRPSSSGDSGGSGGSSSPAPAADTNQPKDTTKPAAPSTDPAPAVSDIFRSEAVRMDSNVVNGILTRIADSRKSAANKLFADTAQHWAAKTINIFVELNIIEGYDDGKFKPDGEITRAEFAVLIDRVFHISSDLKQSAVMNDIDNHWAKATIEKLANAGILNGYGDEFRPDQTVSRAEMVAITSRIVNMNAVEKNESAGAFSDTGKSFASSQIREAAQSGIIAGKGGDKFEPEAASTRAEALTVILNTLNLNPQIKTLLDDFK